MHSLIKLTLASAIAVAASSLSAAPAAFDDSTILIVAKNGADNPPGDVRHGRGKDDARNAARRAPGADDPAGDRRRGRGKDDASREIRRGGGADNPPGDDHGGHGRDDPPRHG